jgi:LCP family protein required for cell wall assembly
MGQDAPNIPKPAPRQPVLRKRPQRGSALPRVLGLLTMACLGAAAGYGVYTYQHSAFLKKYLPTLMAHKTVQEVFPNRNYINLMVIGRDYDYTDQDQIIHSHARSDMLMVGRLDFNKHDIDLLSIPRDTRVDIPDWGVGKINAAHAHGGPQLSERTVQSNFGIPSDNYIALDFDGFEKAIDLMGGVDLTVDRKMDYDDNWGHLHIHLKPGYQHLNGQEAMGFVRFRHADSDFVRVQRQQALLAAIKDKLHQPAVLAKVPEILDELDKHLDSDLTTDQKVAIATFVKDTPRNQIQMDTLPSKDGKGTFVETDWAKAEPMIQNIFAVGPPENVADAVDNNDVAPRHHRRRHHRPARVAELP